MRAKGFVLTTEIIHEFLNSVRIKAVNMKRGLVNNN